MGSTTFNKPIDTEVADINSKLTTVETDLGKWKQYGTRTNFSPSTGFTFAPASSDGSFFAIFIFGYAGMFSTVYATSNEMIELTRSSLVATWTTTKSGRSITWKTSDTGQTCYAFVYKLS